MTLGSNLPFPPRTDQTMLRRKEETCDTSHKWRVSGIYRELRETGQAEREAAWQTDASKRKGLPKL